MHRRNKYIGPRSCYAVHEGVYVPRADRGLNEATFFSVVALILRDAERGWSYDDYCQRIPFSREHALQRVVWGGALAFTFTDRESARALMELGREALESRKLPEWAPVLLAGENAERVASELVRLGIVSSEQVRVVKEGEELWLSLP